MTRQYVPGRVIVSVLAAFLLAGFAGGQFAVADTEASAVGKEVNACALMSDDEVAAATNFKVGHGVRKDSGQIKSGVYEGAYSSTCLWRAVGDEDANDPSLPLGGARFAILNVMSWPAGSHKAGKFLQDFRDAGRDHIIPSMPVALKIGDEALWWGDGVAVRKGDISFGVSVHTVKERPNERQMEATLAEKIVKRF